MSRRWMPAWYHRIRQGREMRRITAGCEVVGVDEVEGFVVVRIPDRLWSEVGDRCDDSRDQDLDVGDGLTLRASPEIIDIIEGASPDSQGHADLEHWKRLFLAHQNKPDDG